jgi:hypothetical protein
MIWWERKNRCRWDEPENFMVVFRQPDGRNRGNALESGKTGHSARMTVTGKMGETIEFTL